MSGSTRGSLFVAVGDATSSLTGRMHARGADDDVDARHVNLQVHLQDGCTRGADDDLDVDARHVHRTVGL